MVICRGKNKCGRANEGVENVFFIKGYAVNERIRKEQIGELRQLVGMLGRTIQNQPLLSNDETNALFEVVTDYTYALDTLDNYDYERLTIDKTTKQENFHATYENAMEAISGLRDKFGGSALFGNEKDDSFKSSIGQIYQTFGGEKLYQSKNGSLSISSSLHVKQSVCVSSALTISGIFFL